MLPASTAAVVAASLGQSVPPARDVAVSDDDLGIDDERFSWIDAAVAAGTRRTGEERRTRSDRIDAVATKLKNAKTLHDYDNYQAALDDYAYTGYRASTGADGYETKYNELKQFFTRTTKKEPPKEG